MIPYFELHTIDIGFIHIKIWGTFIAAAFLVTLYFILKKAEKQKLQKEMILNLGIWIMIAAILGGRIFYFLTERFDAFMNSPIEILKIWQGGLSIYGGFFGALIVLYIFSKKYKVDMVKLGDIIAFYLPLGLFIGRLGCFFIHDHKGIATDSLLGVEFTTGTAFDLGLLLSLSGLVMFIAFLAVDRERKDLPRGFFLYLFLILYGCLRLGLDFLREWTGDAADARFLDLTAAQYFSIAFIAIGLFCLNYEKLLPKIPPKDTGDKKE